MHDHTDYTAYPCLLARSSESDPHTHSDAYACLGTYACH